MRQHTVSTITNPRPNLIANEFVAMLKDAGVVEAYLFGSFVCGEERDTSDIDLLVMFGPEY